VVDATPSVAALERKRKKMAAKQERRKAAMEVS